MSRGDDGGFNGSRRSSRMCLLFATLWRHAASILFGSSGALTWTAPGICCGARIQFHLARGQLRLRPTTIRVVPSCTSVASLLVRHDRRRGFGQASASLRTSLCTLPVNPCTRSCLQSALAGSQVAWFVLTMGCRAWAPCSTFPRDQSCTHFSHSAGSLLPAVHAHVAQLRYVPMTAHVVCVA